MKKSLIVLACIALVAVAGPARAAEVTVDFDINFPSFLILSCYDNFSITISGDNLATLLGASGAEIGEGITASPDSVGFDGATGITATFDDPPTTSEIDPLDLTLPLALTNLCAVRAIGNGGNVQVAIDNLTDWTGTGTNLIELVSATPSQTSFPPPGLANAEVIDVGLILDISDATQAGIYQNGSFRVTANLL